MFPPSLLPWILVPTTNGLRVADYMEIKLAPSPSRPSFQLPHSLRQQPSSIFDSFPFSISEINVSGQNAANEPSHAFAVERRALSGSRPSEDRLMSLTQRLCEAEAKADQQRRLRQRAEEQLSEVRQSVRMQQQQVSSLQQRLPQLEAGGAAGGRSELSTLTQLRDQQEIVACMQTRIDELQARNEQLERAAGQPRPPASASSSECCACCSEPPSVLYQPCLHLCVCEQCDQQMASKQCPMCRAPIQTKVQPVRLA